MQSQSIALGALIKIQRRKRNLSQSELSKGICAVSYLSKLENGEIAPSEESITLLLKALDIKYFLLDSFAKNEADFFEDFFMRIFNYDTLGALQLFDSIKDKKKRFLYSPLIIDYMLAELYYLIIKNKKHSKKTLDIKAHLESVETMLSGNKAVLYYYMQSFFAATADKEKEYFHKAINIRPLSRLYKGLAFVYTGTYNYNDALTSAKKSMDLAIAEGNFRGIVFTNNSFGEIYSIQKEYDKAESYYRRNINLLKSSNTADDYILCFNFYSYVNIANIAFHTENNEELLKNCNLAIENETAGKDKVHGILQYLLLCEYYNRQNDLDKSREMIRLAINKSDQSITADLCFEMGMIDILKYQLLEDEEYDSRVHLKKLKNLKKLIADNRRYHHLEFANRKLIDYYIANKKYKDAFLLTQNPR